MASLSPRSSLGALLFVLALLISAVSAVDRGPGSNRFKADASPMQVISDGKETTTNIPWQAPKLIPIGIASHLPPHDISVVNTPSTTTPRLVQKLALDDTSSSSLGAFNVKAVAYVGISFFLDLAAPTNSLVNFLVGNDTANLFAKTAPAGNDAVDYKQLADVEVVVFDDECDGAAGAASPRRKIAGMSVALVLVMIFFTVWM